MDRDPMYTFGEMLRAFRQRQRVTQQQLAAKVGIHRNTISGWERGDYLPVNKGVVLRLARHLHLDDQEARQFLEASLLALAPYWGIPALRNPFFTGREEILEALHASLHNDQSGALTRSYALHGLGGIGKTQVAVEYAYRYALEYSAVFWIAAESVEQIMSSFLHIANVLNLPEQQEADQQKTVVAVQRWLTTHSKWLLIWDNLEDLELLQRFLPATRQGMILITTRFQALGTFARNIALPPMTSREGALLLLRRAKMLCSAPLEDQMPRPAGTVHAEYAAAQELVTALGGLPLALDQAGAYIEETGCSITDYLSRFEQQRAQLLARRGTSAGDHPQSVATTFKLAIQRVERDHPMAVDMLRICAFLHAEAIPEEIFVSHSSHPGSPRDTLTADPYHFDLAIASLRTFSLVQRHAETRTFSIHRLVQAVLQAEMDEQARIQRQRHAIQLLNACFPPVSYEVWKQCERLLLHVLACAAWLPDEVSDRQLIEVLQRAADYLRERAQYEQAEPLYLRALRLQEQAVEASRLQLAFLLNNLAILYTQQGKYEQAEQLYLRALHIREEELGSNHLRLANPLNNLANLYLEQGKSEQAEPLYLRALCIREQALGPDHLAIANPLNNLAWLYQGQGKYEQAELLYQRALRIREQALGPDHPEVARPLNNLAQLYQEQGRYEQAEALYRRALHIWEQTLGPDHPEVTSPLNGLATLYREQEKCKEAEQLYRRALAIRKRKLGISHPETAQTLHDLAICVQKLGNLLEAVSYFEEALTIRSQSLGDSHPKTITTRTAYAALLHRLGRPEEAGHFE
jgi:tetratricopeptide (TPR) repeat protein